MSIENSRFARQLRIKEILGLEREPAAEVWKKVEAGKDEAGGAEELGFPIEYFRTLLAQEFMNRLNEGQSFVEFPKFSSDLETHCWKNVASLCTTDLTAIIQTPICKQFRLKLLGFHYDGVPLHESMENFNLTLHQAKSLLMIALAEDGMTLNEIALQFGLSRERARQILREIGFSIRTIRNQRVDNNKLNQELLTQTIVSWITAHPGCRVTEVSYALSISESVVISLCPQATKGLLLIVKKKRDSDAYRRYSRQQTLDALKKAFEIRNPSMSMYSVGETEPLTGPFYEKLRNENAVVGPSQARIIQVFGTWKEACEEAGVPCVDAVRDVYELRWTDDELINQLAEFISTSESPNAANFETWCQQDDSRASLGTIRNQIGQWAESSELALLLLRKRWISE